jgi:hypothetical protein
LQLRGWEFKKLKVRRIGLKNQRQFAGLKIMPINKIDLWQKRLKNWWQIKRQVKSQTAKIDLC